MKTIQEAIASGKISSILACLATGQEMPAEALYFCTSKECIDFVVRFHQVLPQSKVKSKNMFSALHAYARAARYDLAEDMDNAIKQRNVDLTWAFEHGYNGSVNESDSGAVSEPMKTVDVNKGMEDGVAPLLLAAQRSGSANFVKWLISKGAHLNVRDHLGYSPLMLAVSRKDEELVDVLIGAKADPDVQDNNGITALNLAAQEGNIVMTEKLIKANASINLADNEGYTPLLKAALFLPKKTGFKGKHCKVIELLLKNGADKHARIKIGGYNFTALTFAQNHENKAAENLLK